MGHDHSHGHEGHVHTVSEDADTRRLTTGLALIVAFMVVEVVAGILADSLALISDAAHMLTDAGALLLSLVVIRLVRRPAQGNVTFGLRRMEMLSAQANGATLLVLAGLIAFGAVQRLIHPPEPGGWTMVVVALVGLVGERGRDARAREGEPLARSTSRAPTSTSSPTPTPSRPPRSPASSCSPPASTAPTRSPRCSSPR